jgi:ATP-dependent Lon protease
MVQPRKRKWDGDDDENNKRRGPITIIIPNFREDSDDSDSTFNTEDEETEETEECEECEVTKENSNQIIPIKTKEEREFYEALTKTKKTFYNKNMKEVNALKSKVPIKFHILGSNLPASYKKIALSRLDTLQSLGGSGEYGKLKQWVDGLLDVPFGVYTPLPVSIKSNTIQECANFIHKTKVELDKSMYGMIDAKISILELMSQWVSNPDSYGQMIAFQGPAGIGKTTICKEGIAKVLGRPFFFVGLGGATDSSFFKGHSYTYEGSTWGKIADICMKARCMNPIIYFDELDKVSNTEYGKEIIGVLTHLTDKAQNMHFHDKYFGDMDIDISKALFIFSFNDESMINPILKDRLSIIRLKGYDEKEKKIIVKEHILPKIFELYKAPKEALTIPDDCIERMIKEFSNEEKGVRSLIRGFEQLFSRLNILRFSSNQKSLEELPFFVHLQFPLKLSQTILEKVLELEKRKQSEKEELPESVRRIYL